MTIIFDKSEWVIDPDNGLVYPESVAISLKGDKGNFELTIDPSSGSIVNEKIQDGVYAVQVDSCGIKHLRYVTIAPAIICCIDKGLLEGADVEKAKKALDQVRLAKLAALAGDPDSAKELLSLAQRKVNNISCNCDC